MKCFGGLQKKECFEILKSFNKSAAFIALLQFSILNQLHLKYISLQANF